MTEPLSPSTLPAPPPEPVLLTPTDLAAMEYGRKRLAKLERLSRMGKPGIDQLRKILRNDIAEFDRHLSSHAQAVTAAAERAAGLPGLPHPPTAGAPS